MPYSLAHAPDEGDGEEYQMLKSTARALSSAIIASAAALAFASTASAQAVGGDFPAGPQRALVQEKCTSCHAASQVTAQRRTQVQWTETVNRMIDTYGAPVSEAEFPTIVAYLAQHFGPAQRTTTPPAPR
jgi:Quinohemoprotein amine dehydrogenase A, alpha subunit, haem binding